MVEGQGPCFLSSLGSPRDRCNSLYIAILRQVQESSNGRLQSPQRHLEMGSPCVCITVMKGHSWHLVSDGKQRCEGSAMHATAWPQEKRTHRRAVPSTQLEQVGAVALFSSPFLQGQNCTLPSSGVSYRDLE